MAPLLRAEEAYQIRGAAFDVHTQLGPGHAEEAYEEALKIALRKRGVAVLDQVPFGVVYEETRVGSYRPDLLANETILLELKAVERLLPIHEAQLLSYLRVTALELGLLINFGAARAQAERRVLTQAASFGAPPDWGTPYAGGLEGLPHPELLWAIGNCVRRVHFTLGTGFLFHVYERALFFEMGLQGLPREPVKHVPLEFDGQTIGRERVHFLVVDGKVLAWLIHEPVHWVSAHSIVWWPCAPQPPFRLYGRRQRRPPRATASRRWVSAALGWPFSPTEAR